jgi:hypothetical protein
MKKYIVILLAGAALVGCQRASDRDVNEPAGADMDRRSSTNISTNDINEPSGSSRDSSSGAGSSSSTGTGSSTGTNSSGSNP